MEINIIRELFYVSIAVLSIFMIVIILVYNSNKKKINQLREYEINISANIDETIPALLEMIVSECFNEYTVLNVAYKNITYINDELEQEIMKGVGEMVSKRISPALISKFSLYYNLKAISDIISEKIYILVMSYVVETNQEKNREEVK